MTPVSNAQSVVHIGLPKTASTFMQRRLFPLLKGFNYSTSNASGLQEEFKWVYRLNGPWLSFGLDRNERRKKIRQIFDCEIKRAYRINTSKTPLLLSSEGLVGNSADPLLNADLAAALIAKQLPNAKIILCLRRQDSWASSIHRQLIFSEDRYRRYLSFNQLFGFQESSYVPINMLCWKTLVEIYYGKFGKENVCVLPFELMLGSPKRFVGEICNFVDVELPLALDYHARENVAPEKIVYSRWGRFRKTLGGMRDGPDRLIYELSGLFHDLKTFRKHEGKIFIAPKDEDLRKIISHLKQSNQRLSEITGLSLDQYGYH